ncbi:MAG: class I SAM-dependent methyltransferase [Bacillota bacterium]|nr:class I SAM-dependent methyltransferase [Bacillota bacterium]
MDLHDLEYVADNYDLYVNVLQSKDEPLNEKTCVDFHLELSEKYGHGGIIDIGCGTGCTLLPLIEHGYDVMGLDISQPMLEVLNKKLHKKNLNTQLICSSMSKFSCDKKFSLAIIPRSGLKKKSNNKRIMKIAAQA